MVTGFGVMGTKNMTLVKRLSRFFGHSNDISYQLYGALVSQARKPAFYTNAGVPDTMDGRFDMIVMHTYLIIRRLNDAGESGKELAQQLFDDMFLDMDRSLREVGVGDLSVPKKIKVMAKAFYGRCTAYEEAMDAGDLEALADVIQRNIFADINPPAGAVRALCGYMFDSDEALQLQDNDSLLQGKIGFSEFSAPEAGQI